MTVVALTSAKGAPGVSTSALLLAALWPQALLVEADPWGGDLHYRLTDETGQTLRPDLGVVSLLSAHNRTGVVTDRSLAAHAQQLPGGLPVVVGPSSPAQVEALRGLWPQLATAVTGSPEPVVLDVGRSHGHSDSDVQLLRAATRVLLVCRPDLASLVHTRDLLDRLATRYVPAEVLLIGNRTQRDDAARALGNVPVHVLPEDPAAASALLAGEWSRKLDRSALIVAGRRLVTAVAGESTPPVPASPPAFREQVTAR
jgi:MinD-like ATPase involved in chromosome partitioning or flagellar assembly